jgi:hypothetical protein
LWCLEDVEKDLRQVNWWWQKAVEREEWASVIKEAEAVCQRAVEPRSKQVSK